MKRIKRLFLRIIVKLDNLEIIRLSDEKKLKMIYFLVFDKKLDLKMPETFNEKLQWLKINDRKTIYTTMVDKYEVKEYVSKIIGDEYIIPTIGIFNNIDEIDFEKLPNQFVIKCTHDSGGIVICENKENFDIAAAKKKIKKFQKRNFYNFYREWPYKDVKHRIIVEKYVGNSDQMVDYKLMCFNGKFKYSFVCTERFSSDGLKVTFFDKNWNKMPFTRHYKSSSNAIEKPKNYSKMIVLAERLSKNIPFLRVDFYEVNNQIYFGELTLYPGAGFEEFTPEIWDKKLGDLIDLNWVKNNET